MNSDERKSKAEHLFEATLLSAICKKLIEIGEIETENEFLDSYPKDRLADVHNNETGAYYLMTGETPVKLVEYNLVSFEVFPVL
ncbi:hypothetical protein WG906_07490 [Pedobacter sp. P351]|uniref:hypothetical protein n=1 Tax=Pedobacter superstes TaxID=3133441 RepID=UPI0030B7B0D1